ncbi:MAG TPA: alpha/beta hydrolase [Ilumatobacteraceae bacterium]
MDVALSTVSTRRGIDATVRTRGDGPPLVWLHGAGGPFPIEPMLDVLAEHYTVHAPEWPGYGEQPTEGHLHDMLDFTLHGWDVIDALGLDRPHLVGHSMGGMIAAEMAAVNPSGLSSLTLVCAVGLWLDEHPVPDIFSMLPFELADVLFADPKVGEVVLTAGLDFSDDAALTAFMVGNARRLGTAGKILFPIPNRRLSDRLYRVTTPTLLLWGTSDRLVPPVYAERFRELLVSTDAALVTVPDAGHMLPYEQPAAGARAVLDFLRRD